MDDKSNKKYYKQGKAESLADTVRERQRIDKCKALGLPTFLAPFVRVTKLSVGLIASNDKELLEMCQMIVDNHIEVTEHYKAMLKKDGVSTDDPSK